MAIEEIEVFRDVPAKPGKKRRPHREAVGKVTEATQLADVKMPGQEGGLAAQALEGRGEHGKEGSTNRGGKVFCQQVEVEVVKIPPNPRLVWVEYHEEGGEHKILVRVGRNANFKPRMRFKLERPADWSSRTKPWDYRGRLPRLPGRW